MSPDLADVRIGVVGLGYVGLPLAVSFSRHFPVVGLDIDQTRVDELRAGHDRTRELDPEELAAAADLTFTTDSADLADVNVYVVTTPTPIDEHKRPDLGALLAASRTVGGTLAPGDAVVYESTVYPGATEEDCVPVLEEVSGLELNEDFFVGYSPERINPGDKEHRFETIVKVTSGSTDAAAEFVDALYARVVTAGTHRASSIKVAEAAKVIENTQRDINIALVNELALVFDRLGIDTHEVLEAAGTKWNFLRFRPGLVGGHCIGVDPYYLTHKAQEVGYHPEVILAGRRLNDGMGRWVAGQLVREMLRRRIDLRDARVLVMGLTFKENTPDLRNTRVVDIDAELRDLGIEVHVTDPWVDPEEARAAHGITMVETPEPGAYDAVVVAVGHHQFIELGAEGVRELLKPEGHVLYDLKGIFPRGASDLRL